MKVFGWVVLAIVAIAVSIAFKNFFVLNPSSFSPVGGNQPPLPPIQPVVKKVSAPIVPAPKNILPESVLLSVPFQVQAPAANWDSIHEDACEEASLLMVGHYRSQKAITDGNDEINSLLDQERQLGYGPSITLSQLNTLAEKYFGLNQGKVQPLATTTQIKTELAAGRPLIIPAAGKELNNPNFKNGGPNYHMLVIIGYVRDEFITNDPGTRNGAGYRYNDQVLFSAIHDWNADNILNGTKEYLVFE